MIHNKYNTLNPYELCPCESGNKFKFCCYKKAKKAQHDRTYEKITDARLNNYLFQNWKSTDFKTCYINDTTCNGAIKAAHSVQNNRILNRISEDGHLYIIDGIVKKFELTPEFKKISKNKASTFFGFCDYHDNVIFSPIETKIYTNTEEQNFLFSYRSFCVAYHKITRKMNLMKKGLKENPESMLQEYQINMYRINQFDLADAELEHKQMNEMLKNENYSDLKYFSYTLNYEINFATASYFAVAEDMNGNEINNTKDLSESNIIPRLFVTVFPTEGKSLIIIACNIKHSQKYENLFQQFSQASEATLLNYLNYIIINYTEDYYFRPSKIDSLSDVKKHSLLKSFESYTNEVEKLHLIKENNFFNFNIFDL
ncbi:SEC-C domain-containing protein [Carnobacterium maltaromaticum]|uniref:SEC-C domain-containing protein n=1 Tax=Carnobacterium maltaromaticum TaxID=2751 RepID=UPI0012F73E2E|nr:SEC-C domain-containing protein [Carnobacterium maltaromaticum]